MARPFGSGAKFQQAKKTVEKDLLIESHVTDNLQTALDTMKDCMGSDNGAQTRMAAAKWHLEVHAKYSKKHGGNPKPADFVEGGKSDIIGEEGGDSDNVISMDIVNM